MLHSLLGAASEAGLIKEGAAASNLATSMRQQLQQAGILQHLTAVMTTMAADLRSEAAALTGQSDDLLGTKLDRFEVCNSNAAQRQLSLMQNMRRLLMCLR